MRPFRWRKSGDRNYIRHGPFVQAPLYLTVRKAGAKPLVSCLDERNAVAFGCKKIQELIEEVYYDILQDIKQNTFCGP